MKVKFFLLLLSHTDNVQSYEQAKVRVFNLLYKPEKNYTRANQNVEKLCIRRN